MAKELKARGLSVWVDEEHEMTGDVEAQMKGIDESACVAIFITQGYAEKVARNTADSCKMAFVYAKRTTGVERMIPVVMEAAHVWHIKVDRSRQRCASRCMLMPHLDQATVKLNLLKWRSAKPYFCQLSTRALSECPLILLRV